MAFYSGQHVACIDDKNWRHGDGGNPRNCPVKGLVYTIREVNVSSFPVPVVSLMEFHDESYFMARRFRPLQKLDVKDFIPAKVPREMEPA